MKTTKKQLISEYQDGNYAAVEIYRSTDKRNELHTDYMRHECETLDELPDDYDIACEVYELDQDEYNNTILANACQTADFKAWYGDHDVDPAACDYYEDDDIDVPSLTERERYELQCEINETAADCNIGF